jgi:PPP family 3-phenylpropionic acid transporter
MTRVDATPKVPTRRRDLDLLFVLGGVSSAALLPFWVLLLRERGLAPDVIGFVLAAGSLSAVLAAPAWSHMADTRLGTVRTLRRSTLTVVAAAMLLAAGGSNPWMVGGLAAILGAASAPSVAFADTIALGHLGSERMYQYGRIRLWASLGWAVAVVPFGWWFQRVGTGPVLPVYAAGILAYRVLLSRFPAPRPAAVRHEHGSRLGAVGEAFRAAPRLRPFLIGLLLVSAATWGAGSFVPLRIAREGQGEFLVGLAASVAAVIEIPIMSASGWLSAHVGMRRLFLTGCIVYVAMLFGWAILPSPVAAAVIRMVSGFAFGLTYVAMVVITARLVPLRVRNTGQALMQVAQSGIGPIAGQAVGGIVFRHLGPGWLFGGAAAIAAVGGLVVWRAIPREEVALAEGD